jgi:ferrochelatase
MVTAGAPTGVVVMSYGTPARPEEIAAFYTDVRRGRPPTPEQLADLTRRYEAIGGTSPLAARTAAQVHGIGAALAALRPGAFVATGGCKHSRPTIEDAVAEVSAVGAAALVGLVLAPQYSALSVGEYASRLEEAARRFGLEAVMIESWHLLSELVEVLAARLTEALARLEARSGGDGASVVFTAHSLPRRILASGDPYPLQVAETAAAVAARAGVRAGDFEVAWQSAGRTAEPWLEPSLLQAIASAAGRRRARSAGVVVCPVGFTSDHLEVLYDVDVEAARVAASAGLVLERTASLNDEPKLMRALAGLVVARAATAPRRAAPVPPAL